MTGTGRPPRRPMADPADPADPAAGRSATNAVPTAMARVVQLAPLALVVVAEAAWISVFAGLAQEFSLHRPVLGQPVFVAFVVGGALLARWPGSRLGRRWPGIGFGLVLAAALGGVLLSADARGAIGDGGLAVIAAHPGGLLAGLALLRGFAHARLPLAEGTVARLLAIGVPALAFASALGGLIGEPYRSQFLGDAFAAAIVFVSAAVLALALAQLDTIGVDAGFDWRRNPPWLLLAVALLGAAVAVAIPLATVAGSVIAILVSVLLGPLLIVGIATGFDRVARRIIVTFAIVATVAIVVIRLFGRPPLPADPNGGPLADQAAPSDASQVVAAGLGGLLLVGAVIAILVLTALWMRRTPVALGQVGETRTIDPGGDTPGPRLRRRRFGRRAAPRTAAEAWLALVSDVDGWPAVRRRPAETPAAHAARLRADGRSDLSLDLLAADYALARYGGIDLNGREDRRAVDRWRRLRRSLAVSRKDPSTDDPFDPGRR